MAASPSRSPETSEANTTAIPETVQVFRVSPLIRGTLLLLYGALTIPLPFLATLTHAPIPAAALWMGIGLGAIALYGGLSEQVVVDDTQIQVRYPAWIRWLLRRGWALRWDQITALKPRTTGQGGLVYYFVSQDQQAYLLPMRVAGFAQLVRRVQAQTAIDTQDVKPLSQPWMYVILLGFSLLLLAVDAWTIWTAHSLAALQ